MYVSQVQAKAKKFLFPISCGFCLYLFQGYRLENFFFVCVCLGEVERS